METSKSTTLEAPGISRQTLVSFVRELFNGGYPNPDGEPLPPGPWDPVIRAALKRMANLYPWHFHPKQPRPNWVTQLYGIADGLQTDPWQPAGPSPEPWDLINGMSDSLAELNPQPLPPVFLFAAAIANQILGNAVSRQELIDLIGTEDQERSTERINRFIDDFCGTVPKIKLRWPIPGPQPPWWNTELSGAQLIVMGVQFENAAGTVFNKGLQKAFTSAGVKFIKAGLARTDKQEATH